MRYTFSKRVVYLAVPTYFQAINVFFGNRSRARFVRYPQNLQNLSKKSQGLLHKHGTVPDYSLDFHSTESALNTQRQCSLSCTYALLCAAAPDNAYPNNAFALSYRTCRRPAHSPPYCSHNSAAARRMSSTTAAGPVIRTPLPRAKIHPRNCRLGTTSKWAMKWSLSTGIIQIS